jgi:hypothetical protein
MEPDGDKDIVVAAYLSNEILWFENDGSENFTLRTIDNSFGGAWGIHAADLDNDNDVDVIGAAAFDDDLSWFENDGFENFTEYSLDANLDGAITVFAYDIDDDTDNDILSGAREANDISWWENDLVGIEEHNYEPLNISGATIIQGALVLPKDKICKVFDITGREVDAARLAPGIYFIEVDGNFTGKIVKIR